MTDYRRKRAKLNILVSLCSQVITLLCGLIVPRMMLATYGSELFGATTSITQFLSYITLLEGGIGSVARSVLYKPLAENDATTIGTIMAEVRRFFRVIALIFMGYVLVLGCSFHAISNVECLDWVSTFMLVLVISISSFGQYFIGISYSVLLQTAQKSYITNLVNIVGTIHNTIAVVILVGMECNIILVKLVSSLIFFMKPIILWLFVKKNYPTPKTARKDKIYLTQKWSGLGQHIAYFIHSNTDVVVLTLLTDLKNVAVYSVYQMVISHMQNLVASFTAGMEALFGDMLAKREYHKLEQTISKYEMMGSVVSVILFATTAVLIVPFVRLYTSGVTDANYEVPIFGLLMVIAAVLYCLRMPYHSLVIAAGHFRQTQPAAYGEALINISLSIVLAGRLGLVGVAIGTLVATIFRYIYYVIYLSKHIVQRPVAYPIKRVIANAIAFVAATGIGAFAISWIEIVNYTLWIICGIVVVLISIGTVTVVNAVVFPNAFERTSRHLVHWTHKK